MKIINPVITIETNPSTLSMIKYMCLGFRHWKFHGFVINEDDYKFGLTLDDKNLLSVYSKQDSITTESDSEEKEQGLIDKGYSSIILFYGKDNTSYMRRFLPEEYNQLEIEYYRFQPNDLYYNS